MSDESGRAPIVGLVRVRNHCLFTWEATENSTQRTVRITADKCRECIDELLRRGYVITESSTPRDP